jgi:hypothetical protein
MSFCPRTFEIIKIQIPMTLEFNNFVCRPSIEVRFKAKLSLVKSFPMVCGTTRAYKAIRAILDF